MGGLFLAYPCPLKLLRVDNQFDALNNPHTDLTTALRSTTLLLGPLPTNAAQELDRQKNIEQQANRAQNEHRSKNYTR